MMVYVAAFLCVFTIVCVTNGEQLNCTEGRVAKEPRIKCAGDVALWCNGTGLHDVPVFHNLSYRHICLLDLSYNNISKIPSNAFINLTKLKVLLLSNNAIEFIDTDAYAGLKNLSYMNLTCNRLGSRDKSFGKGAFRHLGGLHNLNLRGNAFDSFGDLETEIIHLLSLEALLISGCTNCSFGPGFSQLTKLKNLSMSDGLDQCFSQTKRWCDLRNLRNDSFETISQVSRIWMSDCNISNIEPLAFEPLRKLVVLDLSYNTDLEFEGMQNALYGLRNSQKLKVLNVNHIHHKTGRGTMLTKNHTQFLPASIVTIHMDLNKIEILEKGVLKRMPHLLTFVTASGNRLIYGDYLQDFFTYHNSVEFLDISRQHLNYDPFRQSRDEPDLASVDKYLQSSDSSLKCKENVQCIAVPANMTTILWRKSFINWEVKTTALVAAQKLRRVDLSLNLIHEWTGPIIGVERIQVLDLSENYCTFLTAMFFDNFWNLTHLNVSGNFLGYSLNTENATAGQAFKNLKRLELLDLSGNRITRLPKDIFKNLHKLRHLNLSFNLLSSLEGVHLEYLVLLVDINLSHNNFIILSGDVTSALNSIQSHLHHRNESSTLSVNLVANPITCSCSGIDFVEWAITSPVQIDFTEADQCRMPGLDNMYWKLNLELLETLKRECRSCTILVACIVSGLVCIATIVVCVLVYRNRWKLRHIYYSKRKRHRRDGFETLFECDAFISYAGSECGFIKQKLVPALEDKHLLKVWVADRDSTAGASIATNITHAIYSSRKTVIILSKGYLKESWCDYELNMARIESIESKRKMIIFVLYDDIPARDIPLNILRFLQSEDHVEYPDHPQDMELFWVKLANQITGQ